MSCCTARALQCYAASCFVLRVQMRQRMLEICAKCEVLLPSMMRSCAREHLLAQCGETSLPKCKQSQYHLQIAQSWLIIIIGFAGTVCNNKPLVYYSGMPYSRLEFPAIFRENRISKKMEIIFIMNYWVAKWIFSVISNFSPAR